MNKTAVLATISLLSAAGIACAAAGDPADSHPGLNLIPWPKVIEVQPGFMQLSAASSIAGDGRARPTADYLSETLVHLTGFAVPVRSGEPPAHSNNIRLALDPALAAPLGEEGYRLVITPELALLSAATDTGLFYGCQTLQQLLPAPGASAAAGAKQSWSLPCLKIEDRPQFPWRGLMLDPARYFLSTKFLKRYIDLMALYKMNRLHLHLTDTEGWTVEIKKYPELTNIEHWPMKLTDRVRNFYRQDDLRELVAYAAARHVMIIPEIEMPSHNAIPATAYREQVLCPNNPYRAGGKPWDNNESFKWMEPCMASPRALAFYQDILKEVIAVFPSPYIHLGGDEYFGLAWEQCPDCQRTLESEKLRETDDGRARPLFAGCQGSKQKYLLYRWWMTKMCDFVRAQGRTPVLWDDLAWRGAFPKDASIMQWHYPGGYDYWQLINTPENPAAEAALAGHDAIVAPFSHLYFDLNSTVEAVYRLEPVPEKLPADRLKHILGPHAPVWGQPENRVDVQVFPRFYALAELGWTPAAGRDWTGFSKRLAQQSARGASVGDPAVLGRWSPAELLPQEQRAVLSWNATRQVAAAGTYQVTFDYQGGLDGVSIDAVTLLEDGRQIARDEHHGWSGANKTDNVYTLKIDRVKPASLYTVEAKLWCPQGGKDSSGIVRMQVKE